VVAVRRVALLAAALTACVAPGSAAAAKGESYVRVLVESTRFDRGAPGPSAGDQVTFVAELRNPSTGGVAGLDRGYCTTVAGGVTSPLRSQCRTSFSLPGGQIDVQGAWDETAFAAGAAQTLAQTAGSGTYATAHGSVRLERIDDQRSRVTLQPARLRPPRAPTLVVSTGVPATTYLDRGLPGRGAYVHGPECIERATQRRAWARAFRRPVDHAPAG